MLASAGLLEPWLGLLKFTFGAKNFTHGLSLSIFSHFVTIHSWNVRCSQKLQKIAKPLFWGSRSFEVIDVDKTKMPLTSVCYDKQHVCAYLPLFYTRKANIGKWRLFKGVPHFDAHVRVEPHDPAAWNFITKKLKFRRQPTVKISWSYTCTVLMQYSSVTDRRTDGRPDHN